MASLDDADRSAACGTMELGPFHCMRNPSDQQQYATTAIHSPNPNATILAICGVTDLEMASPQNDGWFFSDVFAFHYLLKGVGIHQTWLTTLNPQALVDRYTAFVHGSPKGDRKIVLNQELLDKGEVRGFEVVPPDCLKSAFLQKLHHEAKKASEEKRPMVIFLFGHGDQNSHGFIIGEDNNAPCTITTADVIAEIPIDLDLTVVSTACYSEGWIVSTSLDSTCMAAADDESTSCSWQKSGSVAGRYCGSMFASEVINQLAGNSTAVLAKPTPSNSTTPQFTESYAQFVKSIRDAMIHRGGLFALDSNPIFSAQGDDWESSWPERTGIPVIGYETRWACLPSVPSSGTSNDVASGGPSSTSSSRGVRKLRKLVKQHIKSPNLKMVWSCGYGHQQLFKLEHFLSAVDPSEAEIKEVFSLMAYRYSSMKRADMYLLMMKIRAPSRSACANWDYATWAAKFIKSRGSLDFHRVCIHLLGTTKFFPLPKEGNRHSWLHPRNYLAAGLADACKTKDEAEERILLLIKVRDEIIDSTKTTLLADSGIRRMRSRLFRSMDNTAEASSALSMGDI